jgi:hypothetical protein
MGQLRAATSNRSAFWSSNYFRSFSHENDHNGLWTSFPNDLGVSFLT